MALHHPEELLILTKTYPSPSTKYRETTCVAAVNRDGHLRRVFPVPFRFLGGDLQFQKWEWVRANVITALKDNRPESFNIDVDTIVKTGERIGTEQSWVKRRQWVEPHVMESFAALEARRQATGETLGLLRPARLLGLEITAVKDADWTDEERHKLAQEGLFDEGVVRNRPPLRKLPHDFHYRYECDTKNGVEALRHKITDWEAGALYWNCVQSHGVDWEKPFRQRLEAEFAQKDLMLLIGTVHRFPDQWLIVGLVYPPKPSVNVAQLALEM